MPKNVQIPEGELIKHYGPDYAKPREVLADEFDLTERREIEDIIDDIDAFKSKNAGCRVVAEFYHWDDHTEAGYKAWRMEDPEETAERIRGYCMAIYQALIQRKAEFDLLKQEFGDA